VMIETIVMNETCQGGKIDILPVQVALDVAHSWDPDSWDEYEAAAADLEMKMRDAATDTIPCTFFGDVEGVAGQHLFRWTCPWCGTEHETELLEGS
jgi:hypothetical protein